ncbi:hypothetical protein ACHAWF_000157, partial [Thalassiosira exigua]
GTQLHKLRSEAEAERGAKLTKKEWASLASLGPNDLRKIVRRSREEIALERGALGAGDDNADSVDASAKELARQVESAPAEVERRLRRSSDVSNVPSLDYEYTNSSGEGQQQTLSPFPSPLATLRADVVTGLARGLTEREATLVRLRYGLEDGPERTIRECADEMGINCEKARLLQHACLRKLKETRSMESLQEYLLTVA